MENNEEKITEAEIVESEMIPDTLEEKTKKKRRDFYIELFLFFVLGVLVGVAIKTEASKRITMGYEDYKMKIFERGYDINKIQKDLIEKQEKEAQSSQEEGSVGAEGESDTKSE